MIGGMSERSHWAKRRNWLLRRLKGAQSIFSQADTEFLYVNIEKENCKVIVDTINNLNKLVVLLSQSKWKE